MSQKALTSSRPDLKLRLSSYFSPLLQQAYLIKSFLRRNLYNSKYVPIYEQLLLISRPCKLEAWIKLNNKQ